MSVADKAPRARLFLALCPDDAARDELDRIALELHAHCGGRRVRRDNLHLTLVFLGSVDYERIDEIATMMAVPAAHAFTLQFGRTGYWRHNRIVWAAPLETPVLLRELAQRLRQRFSAMGFRVEERPYAAHATLIRDAQPPGHLPPLAFAWRVNDYALMQSIQTAQGVRYKPLSVHELEAP